MVEYVVEDHTDCHNVCLLLWDRSGACFVARNDSPDVLAERLSKRVNILEAELERLSKDHDANQSLIQEKETELVGLCSIRYAVFVATSRRNYG